MNPPSLTVAVVMETTQQPNRWEAWSHRVTEVVLDDGQFGDAPRLLHDDGRISCRLHPGLRVELTPDECKGYLLNLTSGGPVWFVMWRVDESDPGRARPDGVSLSYIMSDRWLSCDERVETQPLPEAVRDWLQRYTDAHFVPDEPRRVRAQSFLAPEERERRARGAHGGRRDG